MVLKKLRDKGVKIVGCIGSYVPEELIYSAKAIPHCLCRGGELEPIEAASPYIAGFVSPFIKEQFGCYISRTDQTYNMLDILVVQCIDAQMSRLADLFEFYTKIPIIKLGVPADWKKPSSFQYYLNKVRILKELLEELTTVEIKNRNLKRYIKSYNRMRETLKKISSLRKNASPPITGLEFIKLNHSTFFLDVDNAITELEHALEESEKRGTNQTEKIPRILLAGHVLGLGDYMIPSLIERFGAVIVAEMFDEGIRHYWWNTKTSGDLVENLARRYYLEKEPSSVFEPAWTKRFEFLKKLKADFSVDGVIWYQLKYDEVYNMESYFVGKRLKKEGVPFLKLESTYDPSGAIGPLSVRIESFIEALRETKRV